MVSSGRFLLLLLVIAQSCFPGECRVQIIGRRKNVEYMGQKDGGACTLCNDGHDLCCPQFTIPLDSSDAFTGPLPSLTIPTEVYTSESSFDTAITSAATIPTVTIPTSVFTSTSTFATGLSEPGFIMFADTAIGTTQLTTAVPTTAGTVSSVASGVRSGNLKLSIGFASIALVVCLLYIL